MIVVGISSDLPHSVLLFEHFHSLSSGVGGWGFGRDWIILM